MYNILGKKSRDGDLIFITSKGDFDKAVKKAEKLKSRWWREIAIINSETMDIEYELY